MQVIKAKVDLHELEKGQQIQWKINHQLMVVAGMRVTPKALQMHLHPILTKQVIEAVRK